MNAPAHTPVLARRPPLDPILGPRDLRLESLKAVVGKLAHDFNNFLVPQFGYLTLLKDEIAANPMAVKYAASMEAAGRKSEAYIAAILLGMRPHRQFSPREFSISDLLNGALDEWSAALPSGASIGVKREIHPFTFTGDERQWKTAIDHLLSNARFALAAGGTLEVTLAPETLSSAERERLGLPAAAVMKLTFRDTGFGMTPETADRAFEPFFTTRTMIKAPGLGLTIIHSIVQFHGGQIELHTAPDAGATVTLWIPATKTEALPQQRLASVGGTFKSLARSSKKALLLETDDVLTEVLKMWCADLDFSLQAVRDEIEAAKALRRSPSDWRLVILGRSGTPAGTGDLVSELHASLPNAELVFLDRREIPVPRSHRLDKPFSKSAFQNLLRSFELPASASSSLTPA